MKYFIGVLIVTISVLSCEPFALDRHGYTENSMDLTNAWQKTSTFDYMADDPDAEYIKSPTEFKKDGGGNCGDFAAYLVYLLGPDAQMVELYHYFPSQEINHAVVYYNGQFLEPQHYNKFWTYEEIMKKYDMIVYVSYEDTMFRSTTLGIRSLHGGRD